MKNVQKCPLKKARKEALKTFKFWYKVLLETHLMDDIEHRKEYQRALEVIAKRI